MDLVRERGYDVARAARELGVPVTTLNMWLKKAGWARPAEGPVDADAVGSTPPSQDPARLRLRVPELERQVKRLEMEKEILKKVSGSGDRPRTRRRSSRARAGEVRVDRAASAELPAVGAVRGAGRHPGRLLRLAQAAG